VILLFRELIVQVFRHTILSLDFWKDSGEASREEGHTFKKSCGEEEGMARS
jgi:hypothetical protein